MLRKILLYATVITILFYLGGQITKTTAHDLVIFYEHSLSSLNNLTFSNPKSDILPHLNNLFNCSTCSLNSTYFHNISGFLNGHFTYEYILPLNKSVNISNNTFQDPIMTSLNQSQVDIISLSIESNATLYPQINWIKGYLEIYPSKMNFDSLWVNEFKYKFSGIHDIDTGQVYFTAYKGIRLFIDFKKEDIASIVINEKLFNYTVNVTRLLLEEQIKTWSSRSENAQSIGSLPLDTFCSLRGFMKLDSLSNTEIIPYLDDTSHNPVIPIPPLKASLVVYSPNCGFILKSEPTGFIYDTYIKKAKLVSFIFTIIIICQIYATAIQMKQFNTNAALNRLSEWTLLFQSIFDTFLYLIFMGISFTDQNTFNCFISVTFFLFFLSSIYELTYMMSLLRVRYSQLGPQTFMTLYFYFGLFFLLVFEIAIRNPYLIILGMLLLYSFWIPQIVKNIVFNYKKSFSIYYILIMTVTRIFLPMYIYGCKENLVYYGITSPHLVIFLTIYQFIQATLLIGQQTFGPRFFIPRSFFEETFNYHPIISPSDIENQEIQIDNEQTHLTQRDCAICFLPVEIQNTSILNNLRTNVEYMITPCHHLFHTECLEQWLEVKLECPICRSPLPNH